MRRISWSRILVITALVLIAAAVVLIRLSPDEPIEEEDVYAYIDSVPVMRADLDRWYEQRSPIQADLTREEFFEETYAPRVMLMLESENLNITVTEEEIDAWITTINTTLQSRNVSFDIYLEDLNVTMERLRTDIYETTLLDKVLESLVAEQVMVTAEEIQEAYEQAGYEALGIPLEDARNEIGPMILREKQDAHLREVVEELRERYEITFT